MIVLGIVALIGAWLLGFWFLAFGFRRRNAGAPVVHVYEGEHAWGEWSKPYVVGPDAYNYELWQERRCQCGNRDFRRAP